MRRVGVPLGNHVQSIWFGKRDETRRRTAGGEGSWPPRKVGDDDAYPPLEIESHTSPVLLWLACTQGPVEVRTGCR